MKKIIILLTILSLFIQCSRCDGNRRYCCNPEKSVLYLPDYIFDWIPYKTNETHILKQNITTKILKIDDISIIDTSVFQGDECPDRPAKMIFGSAVFGNLDTIQFSSYDQPSLLIKCNEIAFILQKSRHDSIGFYSFNKHTKTIKFDELKLDTHVFNDVVLAESDTGKVKKIYLSKYLGIIAIESNDTLFVK